MLLLPLFPLAGSAFFLSPFGSSMASTGSSTPGAGAASGWSMSDIASARRRKTISVKTRWIELSRKFFFFCASLLGFFLTHKKKKNKPSKEQRCGLAAASVRPPCNDDPVLARLDRGRSRRGRVHGSQRRALRLVVVVVVEHWKSLLRTAPSSSPPSRPPAARPARRLLPARASGRVHRRRGRARGVGA